MLTDDQARPFGWEAAEGHLSLGQVLQQKGDRAGAAEAFAEAQRLQRQKGDAQAGAFAASNAGDKLRHGDVAGAIDGFREAVRLDPRNADAHLQLARALERAGRPAEARAAFAEARRLAPWLEVTGRPK